MNLGLKYPKKKLYSESKMSRRFSSMELYKAPLSFEWHRGRGTPRGYVPLSFLVRLYPPPTPPLSISL